MEIAISRHDVGITVKNTQCCVVRGRDDTPPPHLRATELFYK